MVPGSFPWYKLLIENRSKTPVEVHMSLSLKEKPKLTLEAYLEVERSSDLRYEFFDGEIFAMVGTNHNHSTISVNITAELRRLFRKKGTCRVYVESKRVKVKESGNFFYPDGVVGCGTLEILEDELDSLANPVVIFEILSDTTAQYDRGLKFEQYQLIDSLREYILVSQDEIKIEQFRLQEGRWYSSLLIHENDLLTLESIDCDLPLSEIYWDVTLKR